MNSIIEAVYEKGSFRPVEPAHYRERQRVRLHIEPLPEVDTGRRWGTYESLSQTFAEMESGGGIAEEQWAQFESEQKRIDTEDTVNASTEKRRLSKPRRA